MLTLLCRYAAGCGMMHAAIPDARCKRDQHAKVSNAVDGALHHAARLDGSNAGHLLLHHSRLQTQHRQAVQLAGANHPAFHLLTHLVSLREHIRDGDAASCMQ